eukprot:GEMP01037420.1.p1 GENE.GEMP01037420.1~~GEMP01037420.1.p1  ORF type:complete len:520 (+),score=130.93 GEMP01037420.1:149-1708(+)
MDPYKLLGVDRHKVTDKHSLELLRQKTKRLWKEHAEKKQKFECKRVMEAFAQIQKAVLRPKEEIHRSAKERDLDRMYNRQTKEIDKRKKRAKQYQTASERVRRKRLRMHGNRGESDRRRRKRMRIERPKPPPTVATEGLRRLRDLLLKPDKYAKAVKLLHRWVSEYYEPSSREYLFEVLAEMCDAKTVAQDPTVTKDTMAVFSKVFLDSKEWFSRSDLHQKVRRWWSIAAIWNNEVFTDDQFTFTKVMGKFEELLEEFEVRPEEEPEEEDEDSDDSEEDEGDEIDDDMPGGGHPAASSSDDPKQPTALSASQMFLTTPLPLQTPSPVLLSSPSPGGSPQTPSPASIEDEDEDDPFGELAAMRELMKQQKEDDVKSEGGTTKEEKAIKKEENDGNDEEHAGEQEFAYMLLSHAEMFDRMRDQFICCLENLFQKRRKVLWSRPQIERFFQDVYYKRERFTESQQEVISRLQAEIKKKQRNAASLDANTCPLNAHVPVVDGRDTISLGIGGEQIWNVKQFTR